MDNLGDVIYAAEGIDQFEVNTASHEAGGYEIIAPDGAWLAIGAESDEDGEIDGYTWIFYADADCNGETGGGGSLDEAKDAIAAFVEAHRATRRYRYHTPDAAIPVLFHLELDSEPAWLVEVDDSVLRLVLFEDDGATDRQAIDYPASGAPRIETSVTIPAFEAPVGDVADEEFYDTELKEAAGDVFEDLLDALALAAITSWHRDGREGDKPAIPDRYGIAGWMSNDNQLFPDEYRNNIRPV